MTERDWLAEEFEQHRPHLRRVAYQMLGTLDESEDAVQEAWLRLSESTAARSRTSGAG
jgi:DNA-directed RNA polymerase specialized sigma24 family protein